MASDLNRAFLIGRLTKDPDLRYTQNGSGVCSFSIANNRTYVSGGEKKEQVSYFNCIAWGKIGEVIAEYCKKGHRIGIEGRLQQRSWDDQEGHKRHTVEIVVDNFQFLSPRDNHHDSHGDSQMPSYNRNEAPPAQQSAPSSADVDNPFSDDDIPF